jgi:hypothetical protein
MYGNWRNDGQNHLSSVVENGITRWYSYETIILDYVDGKTIGNVTKYSTTTSKHQRKANVHGADILVDGVPAGTKSLAQYIQ